MRICFVRHAEIKKYASTLIPDDVKISGKGKQTAKRVAEYLINENVTMVYCSPMVRAKQTAEIIAKKFNVPVMVMSQFKERLGTIPKNAEEQEWLKNYMNLDYKNGKFETLLRFVKQNYEGLDIVIKENMLKETAENEQTIVIVAHSSNLYAFNAYFNKLPLKGNGVWMQCSNGAVIKWKV